MKEWMHISSASKTCCHLWILYIKKKRQFMEMNGSFRGSVREEMTRKSISVIKANDF